MPRIRPGIRAYRSCPEGLLPPVHCAAPSSLFLSSSPRDTFNFQLTFRREIFLSTERFLMRPLSKWIITTLRELINDRDRRRSRIYRIARGEIYFMILDENFLRKTGFFLILKRVCLKFMIRVERRRRVAKLFRDWLGRCRRYNK